MALQRWKRLAAFVAIVWGTAATFVAFDYTYQTTLWSLIRDRDRPVSAVTRQSISCDVQAEDQKTAGGGTFGQARATAWWLGVQFGSEARVNSLNTGDPESTKWVQSRLAQIAPQVDQLAARLGVPRPKSYVPARLLDADDFRTFLEQDGNLTARRVAAHHSVDACRLYKLGVLWGYSIPSRSNLPGEPLEFAPDLGYYARLVNLPGTLWEPMVRPTARTSSQSDVADDTSKITKAVTDYLLRAQ